MKLKKFILLLMSALILTACGNAGQSKKSDKLQVYTSFYAMYDFAKQIGGDKADVYLLCPVGSEPHDFEPKTSDMAKLSKADVFIYNGMGMESWAEKTVQSLKTDTLSVVEASKNIPYVTENEDAHVWLDPENAIYEMKNIKDAFCAKDASNSAYYESRYEECEKKADKLIDDYKAASKDFKNRTLITSHAAFSYLCDAFNMSQLAIEGSNGESDPSPAKMAEIIDFIKTNDIKYIFYESLDSSKTVDSIANETGAQTLALSPFEGDTDGKDYFTVMEENLETLKKAMN